jgi:RNA polymerase sigma-70 factor (ECF subfamily)
VRSMSKPCSQLTTTAIDENFDDVVLPHLDAAHRLARWLMRNEHDAEDVVQEASLRAFLYFETFTGGSGRAWFLRIVRNTSFRWHSRGFQAPIDTFDEEQHSGASPASDPESLLLQIDDVTLIERAMSSLSSRFRQLLVLRELQGLSYQEVADVMGVPIGTVMSGLSRARRALRGALDNELKRTASSVCRAARNSSTDPIRTNLFSEVSPGWRQHQRSQSFQSRAPDSGTSAGHTAIAAGRGRTGRVPRR